MSTDGGLSLSLHVLDTARGQAGDDLFFTFARIADDGERTMLGRWKTDAGGRWALDLEAIPLSPGHYELIFEAGAYQRRFERESFYDVIPILFRIGQPNGHYHIPLILSPFGYSTYRGG